MLAIVQAKLETQEKHAVLYNILSRYYKDASSFYRESSNHYEFHWFDDDTADLHWHYHEKCMKVAKVCDNYEDYHLYQVYRHEHMIDILTEDNTEVKKGQWMEVLESDLGISKMWEEIKDLQELVDVNLPLLDDINDTLRTELMEAREAVDLAIEKEKTLTLLR
jgi:hypothetical protein